MSRSSMVLAACLLFGSNLLAQDTTIEKPNVVLFFMDDMGFGDIGPNGNEVNQTPHLDRMAKEGIRFTSFYTSNQNCTPSRAALLTGCYADRVGMDGSVVNVRDSRGLNPKEVSIAKMLKGAGYRTGLLGKWHLGDQVEFLPLNHGFDEFEGIPYSNDMWSGKKTRKKPPLPYMKGNRAVAAVLDGRDQALLCDAATDATVDFIRRHKDQPFFAYVPYSYVHRPRYALKHRVEKADGNVTRAQVEEVDAGVGRIMALLKALKLDKKTLVLFTSDNGPAYGLSPKPFRGGKGSSTEGGFRMPFIAWWPGTIPAGAETDEIAQSIDLLPTLAKLTGATVPTDRIIDGKDISPLLLATPGAKSPHETFFYEYAGVRKGPWKLLFRFDRFNEKTRQVKERRLYNLAEDLKEKKDLSAEYPEMVATLEALVHAHKTSVQANLRPPGFVENPVLISTEGMPSLAKFRGQEDAEYVKGKW